MGIKTFESKLVDVTRYHSLRNEYQFGSALDPVTQAPQVQGDYIALDLVELPNRDKTHSVSDITRAVSSGGRIVLTGDYGVGKSMTLRQVYLECMSQFRLNQTRSFVIHLNLRDHQGQDNPVEALERHARNIGFPYPHQLVSAWRGGRANLILDGFDEISNPNWPGRVNSLADVRHRTVTLVRGFLDQTRPEAGVLVAGRSNFFESDAEMLRALGMSRSSLILSASDFTEAQIGQYLASRSWGTQIPAWLPPRPLLVGHLAARGALDDLAKETSQIDADPAAGWDYLVDVLSAREAKVDVGISATLVRSILEELATRMRKSSAGLGPLSFDDITAAFYRVSGYLPDADSFVLLQRLPGLQVAEMEVNTRIFVDADLADTLRAGGLVSIASNPSVVLGEADADWQTLLGNLGVAVCAHMLSSRQISSSVVLSTLSRVSSRGARFSGLAADLVRIELARGTAVGLKVRIENVVMPSLTFVAGSSATGVSLDSCIIENLVVDELDDSSALPEMDHCVVTHVEGAAGIDDIARGRFHDCDFENFSESTGNMASILGLPIPDLNRVMLSILRKLYLQPGKGRKDTAFYRGALTQRQRELVPEALTRLRAEGLAMRTTSRGSTLWVANRAQKRRAEAMLSSPTSTTDALFSDPE